MWTLYKLTWILTVLSISGTTVSVTKNNATLITEALLENLGPPTNRPVLNPSSVVHVALSFVLSQIIELNDMQQELKVAGWFGMVAKMNQVHIHIKQQRNVKLISHDWKMVRTGFALKTWNDERIRWNATEYGIECVGIPEDSIWKPDLTLDNNVDEEYNQFLPNTPITVCSDGTAKFRAYAIFRSSCYISIEFFPYDNQTCTLRFSSWIHDASELDVHPALRSIDQEEQFDDNGVWKLLGVDGKRELEEYKSDISPFVYTVFSFHLLRRHEFQLLFILIPYFFCSFLISLMFFIPIESGEKLSYGITAVLGMIVFQEIIAFSLPPVGNESTIVGKYFTSVICIGIISVFVEIVVNNIHMQGNMYKVFVYLINLYRIKMQELKHDRNHERQQTEGQGLDEDNSSIIMEEHIIYVQHVCAMFDFYFGVLCLLLLCIFMIWFIIVI